MTPRSSLSMGAYSKRESDVVGRLMREHEVIEPLEGMRALGRFGGITDAVRHGLVGNTSWARTMHAAHVGKYARDKSLYQRTIPDNRHPETHFPQRPGYETTLEV